MAEYCAMCGKEKEDTNGKPAADFLSTCKGKHPEAEAHWETIQKVWWIYFWRMIAATRAAMPNFLKEE